MTIALTDDLVEDGPAVALLHPTTVLPPFAPASSADRPAPGEKSDLIGRAYEEYRQLREAGVAVDPDAFCARFPAYQTSLRRLLEVHREVEENPALLEQLGVRWPQTGDEFFGFQLLQELGRGAFARVYLARERIVGERLVALKVSLHPDNEADTLGKLRHPNVVPVFSAQYDPGTGFSIVCMPFLGGATLSDVLDYLATMKRRPAGADVLLDAARDDRWPADNAPPPARAYRRGRFLDGVLHIAERLADALAYVHDRGYLHRDLKPNNVLLCPNGEPVLLDFNLALNRSAAERRTGGTLPYMAPEQLDAMGRTRASDPVPSDARSDIYALGVILYELLTGKHPFGPVPLKLPASQVREFLVERHGRGPRPLREVVPGLDARVAGLIERCLARDPAARPASARELCAALRHCQSAPRRAVRWASAHVKALAVAGVVLVVGAAGGAYEVSKLPSAAERHQRDAAAAGLNGNYADAVRLLTLVLDADPNQPAVYFRRGRAYQLLGRHMDAIRDFERAGPDTDGKLAACLGYSYTRLADQPKAIRSYERAIQTGFANAAVYNNLAFCHLREVPKPAAAHKAATAALDLEPSMLAASYNRALACKSLWWEYQAPDVMTGINDIRRVIAGSLGSHKIFRTAVELCAAELHDRGNPADDPLHVEGAGYLRRVVELSTKPLALNYYADPRMKCVLTWAAQLPQHIPLDPSAGTNQDGPDTLLRLVDPLAGQPE